jgi:hypothetical protein
MFTSGGQFRLMGPKYSYQNQSPWRSGQGGLWLGLSGIVGYVDHRITRSLPATPDFTQFGSSSLVNPGWLYGLGGDLRLQMGPLQLQGSVGYNWDGSDERWRLNGQFINGEDGFVNNSVYYQLSVSYSIPLGGGEATESTLATDTLSDSGFKVFAPVSAAQKGGKK